MGNSNLIDKMLIKNTKNNEIISSWLDLPNGCLCCSMKLKGLKQIEELIQSNKEITKLVIELSGIAGLLVFIMFLLLYLLYDNYYDNYYVNYHVFTINY